MILILKFTWCDSNLTPLAAHLIHVCWVYMSLCVWGAGTKYHRLGVLYTNLFLTVTEVGHAGSGAHLVGV